MNNNVIYKNNNIKPYIVGIDPDCSYSGVCLYSKMSTEIKYLSIMKFFVLFDFLKANSEVVRKVVIEAGWLNKKSNFHSTPNQSKEVGEVIAKKVGANHEVGRKVIEMCEYLNLPHELITPHRKKYSVKEFRSITNYERKVTQEEIDAAMLVFGY